MDARVFAVFVSAIGCLVSVLVPFCPTPLVALVPVSLSYFAIVAGSVNIYTIPLDIWGGEHAGTAHCGSGVRVRSDADGDLSADRFPGGSLRVRAGLLARGSAAVCGLGAAADDDHLPQHGPCREIMLNNRGEKLVTES